MEIGSEFWIDDEINFQKKTKMPYWLSKFGNITLTTSGRGALSLLLSQIKPTVKKALLPSFICSSVILPFEIYGYEIDYYDLDEYFKPVNIDSIIDSNVGLFLHMGYFGFTCNDALYDAISLLKSKSVIVVEDATHTLFSKHLKKIDNDFVIGSIRKWFGIPSGGFLASRDNLKFEPLNCTSEFINIRYQGLLQKFDYIISNNESIKADYLAAFAKAELILDNDIKPCKIDNISKTIIKNVDDTKIKFSRRENYYYLSRYLSGVKNIKIIYPDIENNITPMFFPIYVVGKRDELRNHLISNKIYCPIHWPVSPKINKKISEITNGIYESILSIPCDQRYNIEEMDIIVCCIRDFFKNRM
ncbi:hypothetical protein RJI07_09175 [Mycoplasmatota bacterium WC30]